MGEGGFSRGCHLMPLTSSAFSDLFGNYDRKGNAYLVGGLSPTDRLS